MKATLEFDLPSENEEYRLAVNGFKYKCILDNLDNYLRDKIKYQDLDDCELFAFQAVRDQLHNLGFNND